MQWSYPSSHTWTDWFLSVANSLGREISISERTMADNALISMVVLLSCCLWGYKSQASPFVGEKKYLRTGTPLKWVWGIISSRPSAGEHIWHGARGDPPVTVLFPHLARKATKLASLHLPFDIIQTPFSSILYLAQDAWKWSQETESFSTYTASFLMQIFLKLIPFPISSHTYQATGKCWLTD